MVCPISDRLTVFSKSFKGGYFGNGGHYGPKRADIMVWADILVGADTMVHDIRHSLSKSSDKESQIVWALCQSCTSA